MRRTTKGTRRGPPLLLLGLLLVVLASGPLAVWPVRPAVAQGPAIEERIVAAEIVVGRHYRQAGGVSGLGYDVLEPFFAPYLGFGGPAAVGYPVSVPFRSRDGCVYQAFQILLLQACAALPVRLANTFEILEEAGADPLLMGLGVGSAERDTGATAEEAAGIRMGWLTDSAIKSRYLADCGRGDAAAAIERCGLPMNRPQRFGPFVSQRFQRIAYQRWLDDGPAGIKTGDVTPVLGGDLLKTSGTLPGATGSPHALASLQGIDEAQFTSIAYTPATERNGPAVDFRDRATLGILQAQVNTTDQTTPSLFQPGRQGQELIVGDRVRTDSNGSALVTYFEGTTAEIGPSSEVVVQRVVTGESGLALPNLTLSQVAGQVIYRLTRALLPGARLDIQTPSATATVRGTVLRVSVLPDGGTRVEVFSGQVDVAAAGIVVSVWPGTFTEVTPGQPPAPPALNPPAAPFILTNPDPITGPSSFFAPGDTDALGSRSNPPSALGPNAVPAPDSAGPTASGPAVPGRQTPPPSSATAVGTNVGTTTAAAALATPTSPAPVPNSAPIKGAPTDTPTPPPTPTTSIDVPTSTPEATPELTPETAPEVTPEATPTSSPVPPGTSTPPPTATRTPTVGPSSTALAATPSPTTATPTPAASPTPSVTASPTATATATLSPSSTPTATRTPTQTPTATRTRRPNSDSNWSGGSSGQG